MPTQRGSVQRRSRRPSGGGGSRRRSRENDRGATSADGDAGWSVDVWAARRDRGDPSPARTWQYRLGMRPWDVYVAQILQFQAQLQDVGGDSSGLQRASFVGHLLG
ncbi:MAG TPA: hypothetical protein VIV13_04660, partial [Solirubrobacterales bacterium]